MTANPSPEKDTQKPLDPEKIASSIKSFTKLFYLGGGLLILFSLLHLNNLIADGFSGVRLYNVLANFILGIGYIVCAYLLSKKKAIVFILYGCIVFFHVIATIFFGSWVNIISIIVGVLLLIYMYVLKYQGELT